MRLDSLHGAEEVRLHPLVIYSRLSDQAVERLPENNSAVSWPAWMPEVFLGAWSSVLQQLPSGHLGSSQVIEVPPPDGQVAVGRPRRDSEPPALGKRGGLEAETEPAEIRGLTLIQRTAAT